MYFIVGIVAGLMLYVFVIRKRKTLNLESKNRAMKRVSRTRIPTQTMEISSLKQLLDKGTKSLTLLDVRTPQEFKRGRIKGAINVNVATPQIFRVRIGKMAKDKSYVVYAQMAERSLHAAEIMVQKGFNRVYHLSGGLLSWEIEGYPVEK